MNIARQVASTSTMFGGLRGQTKLVSAWVHAPSLSSPPPLIDRQHVDNVGFKQVFFAWFVSISELSSLFLFFFFAIFTTGWNAFLRSSSLARARARSRRVPLTAPASQVSSPRLGRIYKNEPRAGVASTQTSTHCYRSLLRELTSSPKKSWSCSFPVNAWFGCVCLDKYHSTFVRSSVRACPPFQAQLLWSCKLAAGTHTHTHHFVCLLFDLSWTHIAFLFPLISIQ